MRNNANLHHAYIEYPKVGGIARIHWYDKNMNFLSVEEVESAFDNRAAARKRIQRAGATLLDGLPGESTVKQPSKVKTVNAETVIDTISQGPSSECCTPGDIGCCGGVSSDLYFDELADFLSSNIEQESPVRIFLDSPFGLRNSETGEQILVQINSDKQIFRFIDFMCEEWGHPAKLFRIRRNRDGFYLHVKV